jgi:thiol-disulfide isomerase/thioredoxin
MIRRCLILAVLLASANPPARAQEAAADGRAPNDPRLVAYYEKLAAFLQALRAYSLDVRLDWKVEGPGDGQSGRNEFSFRLERPGRFRLEVKPGGQGEASLVVVGDGREVTTLYVPKALYSRAPLRNPVEGLERNPIVATSLSGSLIDTLMRPDLVEIFRGHAEAGEHLGVETVDGRKLDRFRLRWKRDDEELWIGPEDEPLPRKLVRITKVPAGEGKDVRLVTTASLSWKLGGPIPAETFRLALPEKAERVEDIYSALATGRSGSLLGRPAPEVALRRLAGGEARLSGHKGKDVVVVEFWASWCAPCLETMPKVAEIAKDYRDKGVVAYAVNVGEEEGVVEGFAKGKGKESPVVVVLDPEGRATEAFGITSIPVIALVGKDGTVQAVHLGNRAGLGDTLRRQVDALLRGEDLVREDGAN